MPAAWEVWTLWWLAAFQLAIAYWWWKGPRLEGTKFWVTGLFALNGVGEVLRGILEVTGWGMLHATSTVLDRWTNLFLLAIPLAALDLDGRWKRVRYGILGAFAVGIAIVTPDIFLNRLAEYSLWSYMTPPGWAVIYTTPLWGAVALTVPALGYRLVHEDGARQVAWGLALGVLALRFGEFALFYSPDSLRTLLFGPGRDLARMASDFLRAGGLLAMVAAFVGLLVIRVRREDPEPIMDLAILLVLAGFLFGAGRPGGSQAVLVSFVTLAFVRPVGFFAAQTRLRETPILATRPGRFVAAGAGLFGASLVGVLVGQAWDQPLVRSLLIGAAFLLFSYPAVRWIDRRFMSLPADERPPPSNERNWPVDEDNVTLPGGWQSQLEEGYEAYRSLPADVRDRIDDLVRWQRILLALHGAPKGGQMPAYERTTPGLHLATQAPYAEIGPEIGRANERWEAILGEHGVERPNPAPDRDEPLIRSTYGRAQGLDSPRVKIYELTDLGEKVAEQLIGQVGLDGTDPANVRKLVGEGFGEAA